MKNITLTLSLLLLTACGGGGGSSNTPAPTPANVAPTASYTVACTNKDCTFTDGSSDSDGTIASYAWDFGDSSTSTEASPTHSFADYGDYTVSFTVTDNDGATGTTSQTVTVTVDVQTAIAIIDTNHASVILAQDFNHRTDGDYTKDNLWDDFCPIPSEETATNFCTYVDKPIESVIENGELKLTFTAGSVDSSLAANRYIDDVDELYMTYNLRFDNNYQETGQRGIKVLGIGASGGTPGGGGGGGQGGGIVDGGFSSRYVVNHKNIKQYVYHQDQAGDYGDGWYAPNFDFNKDQDYVVEMRVKMNTPGQANGEIETYINGVPILLTTDFTFSQSGGYGIDALIVLISFNAGSSGTPGFTNPATMYIDDIVYSTERVVTPQ